MQPERLAVLAAAPAAPFPATLPWPALGASGRIAAAPGPPLPDPDPVAFLQKCLERYDREVQGYTLVMWKQERSDGRLNPPERVEVAFREKPFSVFMRWLQGARRAQAALYVEGQHGGKLLALPAGVLGRLGAFEKDPNGDEARQSGRYPITEFGLKKATERVLAGWLATRRRAAAEGTAVTVGALGTGGLSGPGLGVPLALGAVAAGTLTEAEKTLHVEYLGLYRVPQAGDRECYKLHRTRYAYPPSDGVTDFTLYIDRETWLQVGSVLRGPGGELIAEYFFRDIRLNPAFVTHQFDRSALKP